MSPRVEAWLTLMAWLQRRVEGVEMVLLEVRTNAREPSFFRNEPPLHADPWSRESDAELNASLARPLRKRVVEECDHVRGRTYEVAP